MWRTFLILLGCAACLNAGCAEEDDGWVNYPGGVWEIHIRDTEGAPIPGAILDPVWRRREKQEDGRFLFNEFDKYPRVQSDQKGNVYLTRFGARGPACQEMFWEICITAPGYKRAYLGIKQIWERIAPLDVVLQREQDPNALHAGVPRGTIGRAG